MKHAELDHVNISVNNLKESIEWYEKVFGFKAVEKGIYMGNPWTIVRSGDSMICMTEYKDKVDSHSSHESEKFSLINHFGLRIEDRQSWENTLKEFQLKTYYASPFRYPHSTSWYVRDPSGHTIEVALWDENKIQFDPLPHS